MIKATLVTLEQFKKLYFKQYQELLKKECGFFFDEGRAAQLRSVLLKHIKDTGHKTFEDFYKYLKEHFLGRQELYNIIQDITIGETYFFRNLPQLDVLRSKIIPEIVNRKRIEGRNEIKIWSAGCSTGEEVYTLAIIFLEEVPGAALWNISILGTDINKNFLEIAQKGLYTSPRKFKYMPEEYKKKYFTPYGRTYMVKDELKKITRFEHHNLVKDEYNAPEMINADIVFCRNVTIYFDLETTKKVINKIYDTLANYGYLFIGHSETLWQINDKFVTLDYPHAFIYQKDLSKKINISNNAPGITIPEINLENITKEKNKEKPPVKKEEKPKISIFEKLKQKKETKETAISEDELYSTQLLDKKYHEATIDFSQKKYEEALKKFEEIIRINPKYILAYFGKATIFANQGKYDEAIIELNKITQFDNLFLEAYYLLGVLYDKKQEIEKAIEMFEKVVYIDPMAVLAYYHLGNLYKYKGKINRAKVQYKNIINILSNKDPNEIVKFSEGMTNKQLIEIANKMLSTIN